MSERLDYLERCGWENMRECAEIAGRLRSESNTTLALLLAGGGAALSYAVSNAQDAQVHVAATAVAFWLFGLGVVLNATCLRLGDFPTVFNEPGNLNQPTLALDEIRQYELQNLQQRIEVGNEVLGRRAGWLNRCRYAASVTPFLAWAVWALAG